VVSSWVPAAASSVSRLSAPVGALAARGAEGVTVTADPELPECSVILQHKLGELLLSREGIDHARVRADWRQCAGAAADKDT
jgi:hypothetical protein